MILKISTGEITH